MLIIGEKVWGIWELSAVLHNFSENPKLLKNKV